jgi:hypothetical protein
MANKRTKPLPPLGDSNVVKLTRSWSHNGKIYRQGDILDLDKRETKQLLERDAGEVIRFTYEKPMIQYGPAIENRFTS